MASEKEHLAHQQQVFDSMSEWFADREKEVTPDLEPIYKTMAADMLNQVMESKEKREGAKKEDFDDSSTNEKSTPLRILDVACGTGVLWEFLLEVAREKNVALKIQGVDLSPSMVAHAQKRVQALASEQSPDDHPVSIDVIASDIVEYCQRSDTSEKKSMSYDGIIFNACFGNFFDPGNVLSSLPPSTILISHPLGAKFVQDLHDEDATTVPHTLPKSTLEMVKQWTFGVPGLVPTKLVEKPYYLMTVQKLPRAVSLPQIQRYRGVVDTGYGRGGKKLGVPTANLPARLFQNALAQVETGVYFGWASLEHLYGRKFQAVVNVGYSPTFEGEENQEKIIEAHLIDGKGLDDFYGQIMRLELSGYLRPEQKFDSFPELVGQIHADIAEAQKALGGSPYVELLNRSELFADGVWIGSSGGDDNASWEFVDHRQNLAKL